MSVQFKSGYEGPPTKECRERWTAMGSEKVERFGESRIARSPRRRPARGLDFRPTVIRIAAAQESDEKARVSENASGHSRAW